MPSIDFKERIECARRYYELFDTISFESSLEWSSTLQKLLMDDRSGLPELLVLIHPKWYEDAIIKIDDPRGNRLFPAAKSGVQCRSFEIYGYACNLRDQSIHIDHQFPYSKGGVTSHENAMYLCAEHNRSKSTNIHLIDWNGMGTKWVSVILDKLIHEISREPGSPKLRYSKILDRRQQ
jgi:hypothetical protein